MEWGATLTLVFAGIGAAGTIYTVVSGFFKSRAERRAERDRIHANWSLRATQAWQAEHYALVLRCENVYRDPSSIVDIEVLDPIDTLICEGRQIDTGGLPTVAPLREQWVKKISINKEINGDYVRSLPEGGTVSREWSHSYFMARPPSGIAGTASRFRISLTIEERSATRRQRTFIVISQPIA